MKHIVPTPKISKTKKHINSKIYIFEDIVYRSYKNEFRQYRPTKKRQL